jgi:glycosyltransferase involved in cell wall biosynthesis
MPAFKAGGPIQSIANLIRNMYEDFEMYVITSNKDFNTIVPLNIVSNTWQDFENGKAKVIYLSNEKAKPNFIKKLIQEINPNKIFVNGIYSIPFSLAPAFFFPNITIIHVRGMLHPGSLSQTTFKKKTFLAAIKLIGIHKKITFSGSDLIEEEYIRVIFGNDVKVQIAQNFPACFDVLPAFPKKSGHLILLSIALISPIKNHTLVLESLGMVKSNVIWYIYGPIKDRKYWNKIKGLIDNLPKNITVIYQGEINPTQVYEKLNESHFFILPSQSENFGHALYEAMIAGKPIITSHNTPWNLLQENNAGYNVDLTNESIASTIENCALLDKIHYERKVIAVREYAETVINMENIKRQYLNMFSEEIF